MPQQPIGSYGALPVFRSTEGLPDWILAPGSRFAVPSGPYALDFYEVRAPAVVGAQGLGGFLSTLIRIGGVVAAPFTGGLSIPASQMGASALDAHGAKKGQEKQIGAGFDDMARSVTALFDQIQARPVITAADVAQAEQALSQLAAVAQQYGSINFVSTKWSSDAYRPAYERRLASIRQAAQTTPGAQVGGGSSAAGAAGDSTTYAVVGAAALFVLFKLMRN